MRIAVTGKAGQLATCLIERGRVAGHEVIALGRPELDLAEPALVLRALETAKPDVVVSAAAYTAVDKAESEAVLAHAINAAGAAAVAEATAKLGAALIHISTDYVFDGKLDRPYVESDSTSPAGVYGASKLAGERAVLATYPQNTAVLRVAWVYSPFGNNFVKTMLRLARDRNEVFVVADQVGNPTSALEIADNVLKVAKNLASSTAPVLRGVFHMTAAGEASWADFAEDIFTASAANGGAFARVNRISTADYPTPAIRPANSRLGCDLVATVHGVALPEWRGSLETVVSRLQSCT